jgi:hypothetical protein
MYDIIGDIHGYADALVALLHKLGYTHNGTSYAHPSRKVIFVGDYLDRGPKIREVLQIVKSMCDYQQALATLGNHEYNALCFETLGKDGLPLRAHNAKNTQQYQATIDAFCDYPHEWRMYLDWFTTLPLFLELNKELRIVHASWVPDKIAWVRKHLPNACIADKDLTYFTQVGSMAYKVIDDLLKGKEMPLPKGHFFYDKGQHKRYRIRIKWWLNPKGLCYDEYGFGNGLPNTFVPDSTILMPIYSAKDMPVFFGHYWLKGPPQLQRHNVCCLDYSIAKNGQLVAYRWNGEQQLQASNFVTV